MGPMNAPDRPQSGPLSKRKNRSQGDHGASPEELAPSWVRQIRERLLAWYQTSGRDLPWRGTGDPYRILVSEMMLVQTTVAAVVPYFERFLAKFPDVQTLASAPELEVLKAWEGLGYYRRARQLQAAARMIVERHGGAMPREPAALLELPGVGRYIAGAVLSFAFDLPAPIIEANTQRVLARLLALRQDLKSRESLQRLWSAAEVLVPHRRAGDFNQAVMDLGALVCTSRTPSCLICPISSLCQARQCGIQDMIPIIVPRPRPLAVTEACAVVAEGSKVLMVQRGEDGLWPGFWEFPTVHVQGADPARRSTGAAIGLAEGVAALTGVRVLLGPEICTVRYTVTRHRVVLHARLAEPLATGVGPGPGTRARGGLALPSLRDCR